MSERECSRRQFVASGALVGGGVVLTLTGAGAADKEKEKILTLALPFSKYRELRKVGGAAEVELEDGRQLLIARVEEDQYVCVSLKCTHQNCDIEYDKRRKLFACGCHDSSFDFEGKPLGGPATKPLAVYPAEAAAVIKVPE